MYVGQYINMFLSDIPVLWCEQALLMFSWIVQPQNKWGFDSIQVLWHLMISVMAKSDCALLYCLSYNSTAGLIFMLVSLRRLWESAPSVSESAPTQRPVSRGPTRGLMGCVKHSDILQTPVLRRCHMLVVIVMGGSGRLNKQAGDLYYTPKYVRWTHTHSSTPSVSAVRGAAAHTLG